MLRRTMLSAIALCALMVWACSAQESAEGASETARATVLFVEPCFREYQVVVDMLRAEGYEARCLGGTGRAKDPGGLSPEALEEADVVIVGGTPRRLTDEEVGTLVGYVEAGGNLVVLVPWFTYQRDGWVGQSVARVLETFGLRTFDKEGVVAYNKKRWDDGSNICVRGEVLFAQHPMVAGVHDLFMHTGHVIDTARGPGGGAPVTLLAVGENIQVQRRTKGADVKTPALVGLKHGKGRVVVELDVADGSEVRWFGLNGANYKLLANTIEYLVSGKASAKPQGYFTRYVPDIAERTRPIPDVLFVPVELDPRTDLQAIARTFKDSVKAQLGLDVRCRLYGASGRGGRAGGAARGLRLPQPQATYERDADFFRAVVAALDEEGYSRQYDLLAVVTSGHARGTGCGSVTSCGIYHRKLSAREAYGVIVFGYTVDLAAEGRDGRPGVEKLEPVQTLNERDMTHVLMHEFGHFLGFPDYMVLRPYVMSGFVEDSKLEYSELFKRVVASIRLSRAEGLLYERQAPGVSADPRLAEAFSAAAKAYKERRYRDCIAGANRVLGALLEQ